MNRNLYLTAVAISVISSIVAYVATSNIYVCFAILLVYLFYLIFSVKNVLICYKNRLDRIHECFNFTNSFIISLSVNNSLQAAYECATLNAKGYLLDETSHIEHLQINERINYLSNYFSSDIYKMFLNIINAYEDQGGNILTMSETLIKELTRIENETNEYSSLSKKRIIEFSSLWILTYVILLFVRFALSQFYNQISASPLFVGSICIFFVFVLISIHLMITIFTQINFVLRRKTNEKV
ncbi:MAG: hypothetical protein WC366_02820 [Bacilli bacterium]|jgi:hypothetical protein